MDAIVGGVRLDALRPGPPHPVSSHHMRDWPRWQGTRTNLTVRECPHGSWHPDPDDPHWPPHAGREHAEECDGCCTAPRGVRAPGDPVRIGVNDFGRLVAGVVDHGSRHCDGDGACPLHDPTDHHMRSWPVWHGDVMRLTLRECPHGVLHPDPDDRRWGSGVHDCDGCCRGPGGAAVPN